MDLIRICVIPRCVSEHVGLMGVTKNNIRVYFVLNETKGNSSLRILAIRLPPPSSSVVHSCTQHDGIFFTVNEDTSVTAYVRDFMYRASDTPSAFVSEEGLVKEGQFSRFISQGYQEQCVVVKEKGAQVMGVYEETQESTELPPI